MKRTKTKVLKGKGALVVGLKLLLLPILGIGLLILYFTGTMFLAPFIIMLYIFIGVALITRLLSSNKYKRIMIYSALGCLFLTILYAIPGIYHKTRPVIHPAYVDLHEYSPFSEGTKAVTLDEPATFKIEDQLPIIDGATAFYPVYASFAQAIYPKKEYGPYDSEVMSNRTGIAYEYLIDGIADIIFVFGPSDEQMEYAKNKGVELNMTPIGKEAFVFFVHEKNSVNSLTTEEVKGIYSGEITNWRNVGGKNKSIRAFQRNENSGSQTALQRFMGSTPIMKPPVEDIATLMGTMVDVVSDYKNYQNSLGYTFRYYSTEMVESNDIQLLNIDGIEPTVESIRSGEYPMINEFYAVTAGSENLHIDDLIEWILSDQGQEIIENMGYVPIR